MATYHLSVSTVRRAVGQSAVAAAAYRACCRLADERTGVVHDFRRKRGHVAGGVVGWGGDRESLWNAAEGAERRSNAVVAREITLALPHELDDESRVKLVRSFTENLHRRHGLAASWDIHRAHRSGDARNHHAHLLLTTRRITTDNRLGEKTRELDAKPASSDHIQAWRAEWERLVNLALETAGRVERIDRRSLKAREARDGRPCLPMEKLGPANTALERRGVRTEKGNRNRKRQRMNQELAFLHRKSRVFRQSVRDIRVEEAIREVRRVSIISPVPVTNRALAYQGMFEAASTAWGSTWPQRLPHAIFRIWPRGLRTIAFVSRRLGMLGLISSTFLVSSRILADGIEGMISDPSRQMDPRNR